MNAYVSIRAIRKNARGFSLVELLVVVAIMGVLVALGSAVLPGTGNPHRQIHEVALVLEQARAYAMQHATYVWVGFAKEETPEQALWVSAVASPDGTQNVPLDKRVAVMRAQALRRVDLASDTPDGSSGAPVLRGSSVASFKTGPRTFGDVVLFAPNGSVSLPTQPGGQPLALALRRSGAAGTARPPAMMLIHPMSGRLEVIDDR